MKMIGGLTSTCCCLLVATTLLTTCTAAPPAGESFKWIATTWPRDPKLPSFMPIMKTVNREDKFTISCETNDPEATVVLNYHRTPRVSGLQNILTKATPPGRVVQQGQKFVVTSVKQGDAGYHTCTAQDKTGKKLAPLTKGNLVVLAVQKSVKPEIFPDSPTIEVESNGRQLIVCKTKAHSKGSKTLLKWYRKITGNQVAIPASKVKSKKVTKRDGTVIDEEHLTLTNFQASDEGEYICVRGTDGNAGNQRSVTLKKAVDVAPVVTLENPSTLKPTENSKFRVKCTASGSPKPSMRWKMNGVITKNCTASIAKRDDSLCVWDIDNLKMRHDGVLTCEALNLAGKDDKTVTIQVQVRPELTDKSPGMPEKKSLVARSDEAVELFAEVKRGNPLPTFTWYQQECGGGNACQSGSSAPWKLVKEQVPDSRTETKRSFIVTPETGVEYRYQYIVSNPSENLTKEFKLTRRKDDTQQFAILSLPPSPTSKAGVLEVYEGDPIHFECLLNTMVYSKSHTLQKDGAVKPFTSETRGDVIALKFKEAKAAQSHAGVYKCEAVTGSDVTRERTIDVKVKKLVMPSISGFDDVTTTEAESYVITCNAGGSPPPEISWKFNGSVDITKEIATRKQCKQSTPDMYALQNSNQMVVCKLDFQLHAGIYQCIAENRIGRKTDDMTLKVEGKPRLPHFRTERILKLKTKNFLVCSAAANPPANVSWYRYSEQKKGNILLKTNTGKAVVKIEEVGKDDAGAYICKATNKHGSAEGRMEVTLSGTSVKLKDNKTVIVGVVVAAIILLLVAVLFMCWYKRRLKEKYALYLAPDEAFEMDPDKSLFEQSNDLPYNMAWEFPRDRLVFIKTLGSGAFGEVWLAEAAGIHAFKPRDTSAAAVKRRKSMQKSKRYTSVIVKYKKQQDLGQIDLEKTQVAVKKLKKDASTEEYKDLASELKIIIHLGEHKNIVNLLGACTVGGDLNVILECCPHGNLLSFLRARREIFQPEWFKKDTDMEKELTYIDLLMICHQASRGMEFLQSKKCVHRDLAARNVLVGTDFVMKIGDFGLARDISNDDLYLKQTSGLLPVKWMAPESLFDKIFTSMSDVWSFGILLWEVFTLGGSPYPGLPTEDLFAFLDEGKRMERPDTCPVEMYEIMLDCWERSPYARPMFGVIEERIGNCLKENAHNDADVDTYLDYRDAAPPPDDYLMANDDSRKAAPPGDYLMANDMSNGMCGDNPQYEDPASKFSPPGTTYVPPVAGSDMDDEQHYDPVDLGDEPLIPHDNKKNKKPSYEDMVPDVEFGGDDDYLDPTESTYLNPVDMHPTTV